MSLTTKRARLEPLKGEHAELDYVATMDSYEHLKTTQKFSMYFQEEVYRIDDARLALEDHWQEFNDGTQYTYTVLNINNRADCIGCVYFAPIAGHRTSGFKVSPVPGSVPAADLTYWITRQHLASNLDLELLTAILEWVELDWPFDKLYLPYYEDDTRGPRHAADQGLTKLDGYDDRGRVIFEWNRA
jgi:hypothetical protein